MKLLPVILVVFVLLVTATPSPAITPSDDLLIAGAARTRLWVDDLYISNPGDDPVTVNVMWLVRNQANLDPETRTFDIGPKATHILGDVILTTFGMNRGNGAFRITSEGGEVIANLIAVAVIDDENGSRTLGSGFEAIPASAATAAGQTATLMGIVATSRFRTNLFATAGANGVTMELDLLDPWGPVIDTATVTLEPYEPWLSEVTNLLGHRRSAQRHRGGPGDIGFGRDSGVEDRQPRDEPGPDDPRGVIRHRRRISRRHLSIRPLRQPGIRFGRQPGYR